MDNKALSYIFEYSISIPVSYVCSYCNEVNNSFHKIIKKHEEIVMVNREMDEYSFSIEESNKIFNELETKANKEKSVFEELLEKNDCSLIKSNKCSNCKKIAAFSLTQAKKTKIIFQLLFYLLVVIFSFILNIICQNLMLALLDNKVCFFTTIYFYPSVFFVVCFIFFMFDLKKIKKDYRLPEKINYPTIDKNNIEIEKKIYLNLKEK